MSLGSRALVHSEIMKKDDKTVQSVTVITKNGSYYYKVTQKSVTGATKYDKKLLKNVAVFAKRDVTQLIDLYCHYIPCYP